MGYIDVDAHVWETDHTWEFLRPHEEQYRPLLAETAGPNGAPLTFWLIQDQRVRRLDGPSPFHTEREAELFPPGTKGLTDVPARLREMDKLGVDVQVLFPTFWLNVLVKDPIIETALKRSYNRWLASATASSGGRLRWMVALPTGNVASAIDELEFGAENGAVGAFLHGEINGHHVAHPELFPVYAAAERLALTIGYHVGAGNSDRLLRYPGGQNTWLAVAPVTYAFHAVLVNELPRRFPELRWGFFEAGAAWVPWMIQEVTRQDEIGWRGEGDWRERVDLLRENNMYVACQIDDDLWYLEKYLGTDNIVLGSDWGHYDLGSDPAAHQMMEARTDLSEATRRKIIDQNGRRLFNLDAKIGTEAVTVAAQVGEDSEP